MIQKTQEEKDQLVSVKFDHKQAVKRSDYSERRAALLHAFSEMTVPNWGSLTFNGKVIG